MKIVKNKLLLGNCLELIKNIPDNSIDLILTDPPYNITQYSTGNIKFKNRADIKTEIAEWDKDFNPRNLKEDFLRILKPTGNIFIFTSHNLFGKWHEIFDPLFNTFQFCVWHKTNPVPHIRKVGFVNSCELIVCMWNKGHKWNFKKQNEMHNHIESSICMGLERTNHPTQKPLRILEHIIEITTDENDVVFDPFMGSGSTCIAAHKLGRKYEGIELDENYYKTAKNRILSTVKYI